MKLFELIIFLVKGCFSAQKNTFFVLAQDQMHLHLKITRPGVDKVRPILTTYRLTREQCWTVPPSSYLHGRHACQPQSPWD